MGILDNLLGTTVTIDDVTDLLDDLTITPHQIKTEKTVENIILKALREEFEGVHQQYNIGGYLGLKSDIDIGDGDVGIELKLATALNNSAANVQRLFGQAIYYKHRRYDDNVLVVIIGAPKYQDEPFMNEIIKFLEDIDVSVYYLETKKK